MKLRLMQGLLIFSATAGLFLPVLSGATPRRPELEPGISKLDVIAAWGAPKFKVEQEARGSDVWEYGDAALEFREGKLVAPEIPVENQPERANTDAVEPTEPQELTPKVVVRKTKPLQASDVGEFLRDIQGSADRPEGGAAPNPGAGGMGFTAATRQ